MKIHQMDQRTDDWQKARIGIPTASQAQRIITPQGMPSKMARKYMYEKVYERLFQRPWTKDLSGIPHVQHGIRTESEAAMALAAAHDLRLVQVGFCTSDDGTYGCSPDRLVEGKNEAVEIKCPIATTQIGYLLDGMPDDYRPQVQMQLLVGGWSGIHFYSYHTEIAPFYHWTSPDPVFQAKLRDLLILFNRELVHATETVRQLGVWPQNMPSAFPEDDAEDLP